MEESDLFVWFNTMEELERVEVRPEDLECGLCGGEGFFIRNSMVAGRDVEEEIPCECNEVFVIKHTEYE